MAMPEMEARLQGCPVYTVVNRNKEFLLVSDEQSKDKQLGLFFFSQEDAQHLLGQVKEKDPGLAKSASIMQVSLDKVYRFAMVPREKELQGVMFRFFPDQKEVKNALDLFQERGLGASSMVGVPVFQAEGLTIKAEDKRYVPLFFSKEDLDRALDSSLKGAGQEVKVAARKQLAKEEKELKRMEKLYKKKSISQEDLKEQQERTERIRSYAKDPSKPKVDVGSFEQVLTDMQRDDDEYSLWRQVIFVPAGASYFGNPAEEKTT
eukprot:scaffold2274_cov343-Pavlova_lutheri.AAC.3